MPPTGRPFESGFFDAGTLRFGQGRHHVFGQSFAEHQGGFANGVHLGPCRGIFGQPTSHFFLFRAGEFAQSIGRQFRIIDVLHDNLSLPLGFQFPQSLTKGLYTGVNQITHVGNRQLGDAADFLVAEIVLKLQT